MSSAIQDFHTSPLAKYLCPCEEHTAAESGPVCEADSCDAPATCWGGGSAGWHGYCGHHMQVGASER